MVVSTLSWQSHEYRLCTVESVSGNSIGKIIAKNDDHVVMMDEKKYSEHWWLEPWL